MKGKLITEYNSDIKVNEEVINEEKNEKRLYIEGIFSSAEIENQNGRKYKKETLKREVDKLQEHIKNKCLWMELNHPNSPDINLERVAGLIEDLHWQDEYNVYGKAKILDETPMGSIAKTLVKEGNIGISSRGLGQVQEDGYVDHDSFKLICYDCVGQPSNSPSWVNGIYEGKTFDIPDVEVENSSSKLEEQEMIEEAQKQYRRKIWSVLFNIEKEL